MLFSSKKPHYEHLRKKWTAKHRSLQEKFFDKHSDVGRQIALGSLGSLMLLTTPNATALPGHNLVADSGQITRVKDNNAVLAEDLKDKVPTDMRSLSITEEQDIGTILTESFGFNVSAELQGKRLNRSYGLIGGEQHLYRYPGDNLIKHADNASDWAMYGSSGIAPGLGAWGYFTSSEAQMTSKDIMREKYYIAVQTFLAPGFSERTAEYRDFFKYRKMLLINPKTGQAVVTDIADAGPSEFTGKHLGGSPEVMHAIGLAQGPRKGAVLYFFIDDPNDTIPLGPIKVPEREA